MDRILRFKPHLRVELAGDGMVFLIGEHERFLLQGRLHELVAPLIDGQRTQWEITEALESRASPPEILYILATLEQKGYLVEIEPGVSLETAAFWHSLGVDAARATDRLAASPVAVLAVGSADTNPLVQALQGVGVTLRADATLRVVVTSDYLDPALEVLNRQALEQGFRWMPVKSGGSTPWIGPLFRPGLGPCWECLAQRLRTNRPVETFLGRRAGLKQPLTVPQAALPTSARAALDLAALALARWIVDGGEGAIDEELIAFDIGRLRVSEHRVSRRPQCPACGDPELLESRAQRPIVLAQRPKRFTDDGGYRCMTPEETFTRYEHLVSPITGVVTSLGPVQDRDHPLRPVYAAAYFLCPLTHARPSYDDFSRAGLGKGRTAAQSRTGALCEAIERYSAVFQGDEPRTRARLLDLGSEAVHPRALLNCSESQYSRRDQINGAMQDWRRMIPLPFDENATIDWTPAWSLTDSRRRWLPSAYCYLHLPARPEERFCYLDPNGHAAGNCVEEAILQGFFELAERDAVGIWWYNRVRRPAVDLASFNEPYFQALEEHYRAMGYRLWVLDVTNDLAIPAFVALIHSDATGRSCIGFGCHLEARLGVQRALTELNQLFDPAGQSRAPWGDAPLEDASFLFPDDRLPRRRSIDFTTIHYDDLRDDVNTCVKLAALLGLETIVLDQTRPDIGLHTVKVVVPGLRHFWPRFGPGRLYDVPVRLKWLDRPHTEAELNPVHLFL